MGVKHLNSYFMTHCSEESIHKISFESCREKTIVVDSSIYLYKFLVKETYMEQLYLFLAIFAYYKICPIFIFDGKSPPEKFNIIQNRYREKKQAESKYDEIQIQLLAFEKNTKEYIDACKQLEELRKKMMRLKQEHILQAKTLIDAFGFLYFDAPGESDQLCAYFVQSGIAWACLSEDMDMFLLNCPRVLRNISLMNHTCTLYNTENILTDLKMSLDDLTEMVIICGSDYNKNYKNEKYIPTIKKIFDIYYNEYNKYKSEYKEESSPFYHWYIHIYMKAANDENKQDEIISTEKMEYICSLFDTTIIANILQPFCDSFCKLVENKKRNMNYIQDIMKNHGFIFL